MAYVVNPSLTDSTQQGKAMWWTFVVCLVLISIPIKNFGYLVPLLFLFLQFIMGNQRLVFRTLCVTGMAVGVSSLSLMWDSLRGQTVNMPGMLVGLLTYLPVAIVLAERSDRSIDDTTFQKITTTCSWFVIVQSVIGFFQFAASGNADAVCGTFGLLDFQQGSITIAQVYLTFTLFGMILLLLISPRRPLAMAAIIIGLAACALAQSGHQTIFFVFSLAALAAIRFWHPKMVVLAAVCTTVMAVGVNIFYPNTYALAADWYRKVALDPESPKRLATAGGTETLRDVKNVVLGTGLGQYSSRAALITSNEYLGIPLPGWLSGQSDYFARIVAPANWEFQEWGEGSAISKPYYSLLSLVVEFGLVISTVLAVVFVRGLVHGVKLMRMKQAQVAVIGTFTSVGILFFLLCCTIENYMEFSQGVFLPMLLLVIAWSRANYLLGVNSQDRTR